MPLATDFGGFGAIGVPLFINPGTGYLPQFQGVSFANIGPYQKPISSEFTSVGAGARTITDQIDRMIITVPSNTTNFGSFMKPIPGTPYTIDLIGCFSTLGTAADGPAMGITLADSGAGPLMCTLTVYANATSTAVCAVDVLIQHRTSPTANSANVLFQNWLFSPNYFALRITDDGTNRKSFVSSNGKDYMQAASEATNTFVTPTQYGIGAYNANSGVTAKFSIYHFKLTNAILGDAP